MAEEEVLSTEAEVVEQETVSMDDTIRQTYEEIQARESETDEERAERLRDEKGRFVASEKAEEPEAAPAAPTDVAEASPGEAPKEFAVPPELQKLGLRKEEAEALSANPVALQAFMRRSEEMHKGLEQYREKAQLGEQLGQAITPYIQNIQAQGVPPAMYVNRLLSIDNMLRRGSPVEKAQLIHQIARDNGVDLTQEIPQVDPQIQTLQQQIQQQQAWIQQQQQAREWQEREALNSEINSFAQDPKNVYFNQVRNEMAGLLQAGLAKDIGEAYEMAIYANPSIRAQVLAKQQAEAEEKRKAEAARRAQEAKKAASVNVAKRPSLPAAKPIGTMDETIREKARELGLIA